MWVVRGEITNSAGTLTLHRVGSLLHFIGATLGNTGGDRDRDVPRLALLAALDEASRVVGATLRGLSEPTLTRDFPLQKHGEWVRSDFMLLDLLGHLSYHLGQINYHRRLLAA